MKVDWMHVETNPGTAVQAAGRTLTPMARSVRLGKRGWPLALVWNRPVAVQVREEDGQEYTLAVNDATRIAQLAIIGGMIFGLAFYWLVSSLRR
jgi:hypothetical protein